ncbi:arginase [Haloarchaeobius iranensis]|uniref:Arginase n=1 Tax=Haloarchaeobius iranensis TaxID=996166 RepID=A0A1G9W5V3_9EURY|nr:arginase [Haloarchaeobius iranensis]SDM79627.1 arginase [Haloarchaeobius iranensis]
MEREVRIIGAPTDYGANRRGVDMGPSAIRYAGLADELRAAGADVTDTGDLLVPTAETRDPSVDEPKEEGRNAKFVREVEDVSLRLADQVAEAIDDGGVPLVLGGDHSIAIGCLSGSGRDADIGAIWFDAHGDYNTPETSPSGNIHGMPLAAALAHRDLADVEWANAPGLQEENVVWVGLRSLDEAERKGIRESEATAFTMSDIDEHGMSEIIDQALEIATDGVDGIHVSLDLDWLDPNEAPGVGTPVHGGATYREAHYALERVAEYDEEHDVLRSMDAVEVNPVLDEHNQTAKLATELAASALGKRIL